MRCLWVLDGLEFRGGGRKRPPPPAWNKLQNNLPGIGLRSVGVLYCRSSLHLCVCPYFCRLFIWSSVSLLPYLSIALLLWSVCPCHKCQVYPVSNHETFVAFGRDIRDSVLPGVSYAPAALQSFNSSVSTSSPLNIITESQSCGSAVRLTGSGSDPPEIRIRPEKLQYHLRKQEFRISCKTDRICIRPFRLTRLYRWTKLPEKLIVSSQKKTELKTR